LYLSVRSPTAKFWAFRYVRSGKMREMGLGPATGRAAVSLVDARAKARTLFDIHKSGRDPLAERDARVATETARGVTFADAAKRYIAAHRDGWSNARHRQQWTNSIADYATPLLGAMPVAEIDTAAVTAVLEPIWTTKTTTATRLRARIENILDWAKARGYRDGENPARWRGHLDQLLAKPKKVKRRVKHFAALPYEAIGAFMGELRQQQGLAARALEFNILTAARSAETLGAKWSEFDLKQKMWTVPPERMKGGREHRVPLSQRTVQILGDLPRDGDCVFNLHRMALLDMLQQHMKRRDLTVHGFRSTFRDWCAEQTNFPSDVAKMALAHAIGDEVEAAYRRGDLFNKRKHLMKAWSEFCSMPSSDGAKVVVPIHG
jgi:integrase